MQVRQVAGPRGAGPVLELGLAGSGGLRPAHGDPDPAVREKAAIDWCTWEDALLSWEAEGSSEVFSGRPSRAGLGLVRSCAHYFFSQGALSGGPGAHP